MKVTPSKVLIGTAFLLVGLVLGGITGAWYEGRSSSERLAAMADAAEARTRSAEAELRQLNARVDWIQTHLRLGRITMEADHQDPGSAGERAARFFDDLALMAQAPNLGDGERAALENVLAARDEVIARLAMTRPSVAPPLEEPYLQLLDVASPN